jgi:quercetin dioxygenase-like cupin family protein
MQATQARSGRLQAPPAALREPGVTGTPTGTTQQIRLLTACFGPGDRTVFHRDRSPVTVCVLEGHFTL